MKHLTIGIFHDDSLGGKLGKKGTVSDIMMFNRKTDESIFSFMAPVEDKLTTKTQIISTIDVAIVSCKQITPELGETILLLDSMGINHGMLVVPEFADTSQLQQLIKDTSLETFPIIDENIPRILEILETFIPHHDASKPAVVLVDHSFSVKGVGEVILGVVKQGIVHKHDKMRLLPVDKEIVVRSIQMQDKDFDEATAGCRVGLAIKGATAEEMRRGSVFTVEGTTTTNTKFVLNVTKNRFYPEFHTGVFHLTVGMQSIPMTITDMKENSITIETEKPVCYTKDDTFILLDLNAKKLHHMGTGRVV